ASSGAASPNNRGVGAGAFGDNSKALNVAASYQESGSIQNRGNNNRVILSGAVDLTNSKGASVVIQQSDPVVLQHILDSATAIAAQSSQSIAGYLTQASQASAASQDKVLSELSTLAESKQTDGQSNVNKTVLYIVGGLFAAAVVIAYFFRRK
ncbi:MAG: hypothetical protein ACXWIU_08940, partial [Limisphaerales bacterium]